MPPLYIYPLITMVSTVTLGAVGFMGYKLTTSPDIQLKINRNFDDNYTVLRQTNFFDKSQNTK